MATSVNVLTSKEVNQLINSNRELAHDLKLSRTSLKQILFNDTPDALNVDFQNELAKVYAVFKRAIKAELQIVENTIMIVESTDFLLQVLANNERLPHEIALKEEMRIFEKRLHENVIKQHYCCDQQRNYNDQFEKLKARIDDLEKQFSPDPLPAEWLHQFSTSFSQF